MKYTTIDLVEELFDLLGFLGAIGALFEEEEEKLLELETDWYTHHLPYLKEKKIKES